MGDTTILQSCLLYTHSWKHSPEQRLSVASLPGAGKWETLRDLSPQVDKIPEEHLISKGCFSISLCCCSLAKLCLTLWDPMDCSIPGFPVLHCLLELAQTHVHRVGDAIQPSHPLSSPPPPALNPSQHQGLSQWVSSSHKVAKVLEFQLQLQSFQWIFRVDLP